MVEKLQGHVDIIKKRAEEYVVSPDTLAELQAPRLASVCYPLQRFVRGLSALKPKKAKKWEVYRVRQLPQHSISLLNVATNVRFCGAGGMACRKSSRGQQGR